MTLSPVTLTGRLVRLEPLVAGHLTGLARHGADPELWCYLKTDGRNLRSQAAIERIGAKQEGVLRQHMVMPDGFVRDTVRYAITAAEWPEARGRLDGLMKR